MNNELILASNDQQPSLEAVGVNWVWFVKPAAEGFTVQGGPPPQIPNLMKITISSPASGN
jgi:hypothetical protein